jgi:hypothetical protein
MPALVRANRGHHPPRRQNVNPNRIPNTHLTYRERCHIFSLHRFGSQNYTQIASSLRLPYTTVRSAIISYSETPRKPVGRPYILNTPIRKRLIARATINIYHRRMLLEEVAKLEGVQACRRTLVTAFEKEQYHRRVAIEKPLLTEAHKRDRLAWALVHRDWPD